MSSQNRFVTAPTADAWSSSLSFELFAMPSRECNELIEDGMLKRLHRLTLALIFCFGALFAAPAEAACTKGADCYCDKVKNPANALYDSKLLLCEDFDVPTLYSNVGSGNGAPYYGPHHDHTGSCPFGNVRGCNSYWAKTYPGAIPGHWVTGQPTAPTLGVACTGGSCPGMKVWHPTNLWDANTYTPLIAFNTAASDFTFEDNSLAAPTNTASGSPGVFDGNANLVFRMPPGQVSGILGEARWNTVTELGLTQALAYAPNSLSSGIWGVVGTEASWKHNEFKTVNAPNCGFDGLFVFYNQSGPRSGIPFAGFVGAFGSGCNGGGYSGTVSNVTAGSATASNLGINWNTPSNYNQPTDWPEGTWGCVRGHLSGAGSATMRMRVWFQGPNMTQERLLIDFTANGVGLDNAGGYDGLKWNGYANTNQGMAYIPSTALTFRYEDNVHITNGPPVPCSQIGFSGTVDANPPAAPTSLTVM
jgi:hypothetical protein